MGVSLSVIKLADRRTGATAEPQEYCYQRALEVALYNTTFDQQTTGAVYRLLHRAGVGQHTLPLKKASVAAGLITQAEYNWLYSHLGKVRSFSLIPLHALRAALGVFGRTDRSEAVVNALGMQLPSEWGEDDGSDAESDGFQDVDSDDEGGGEGGDGDSVAPTEAADLGEIEDSDSGDAASVAPTEPVGGGDVAAGQEAAGDIPVQAAKRQHVSGISSSIDTELEAFAAFRMAPLQKARKGAAVTAATCESDKGRVLTFMSWVTTVYKLQHVITLNLFASANVAAAAERYINEMVQGHGRKWSHAANVAASLLAAARFVQARGGAPDKGAGGQLEALHRQCLQQARQQGKFSIAETPAEYLDWDDVQRARVAAEEALAAAETEAETLKRTRDVLIIRLLADQPPDRVGVVRSLMLGGSLKRKLDGYQLDLSEPGAHKTAAVFGATKTDINASITPWLDDYIQLAAIPDGGFLFHKRGDFSTVVSVTTWTRIVQATFERHSGVKFCPKDARSSFITFLRSGEHDDEAVKAAAVAMRHSSKTQASAAYDKGSSDRRVRAAMKVAMDYSGKFSAASSSR